MNYNIDFQNAIQKKILMDAMKVMIRSSNPEPQATHLCNQLDEARNLADCLEQILKQVKNNNRL